MLYITKWYIALLHDYMVAVTLLYLYSHLFFIDTTISGTQITHMWYNEIDHYDFESPGFNTKTRNFSQIVWRETTSIGVAKVESPQGVTVVVARYYPTANVLGKFEENVLNSAESPRNIAPGLSVAENGRFFSFSFIICMNS